MLPAIGRPGCMVLNKSYKIYRETEHFSITAHVVRVTRNKFTLHCVYNTYIFFLLYCFCSQFFFLYRLLSILLLWFADINSY